MGRGPCCDRKEGLKKGPWTPDEDHLLVSYINKNKGHGSWRALPQLAGLLRCGKSCRLRWTNYLRPDIKRGPFTQEEETILVQLHGMLGNRWAAIASQLPGRTDNEIKNYWNTHLRKQLIRKGINPQTHQPYTSDSSTPLATRHMAQWESARLEAEARLSRDISFLSSPPLQKCPPLQKSDSDYFLRLWNSKVGESFRKVPGGKVPCDSPLSQASTSTKCGSFSAVTTEVGNYFPGLSTMTDNQDEDVEYKIVKSVTGEEMVYRFCRSNTEDVMCCPESSSSTKLDLSESPMNMLLDYPINNDDMIFWEENMNDDYATSTPVVKSENAFICPL